jgi:hypothetical protein
LEGSNPDFGPLEDARMNDTAAPRSIRVTGVLALAALLGVGGCKSSSRPKPAETRSEAKKEAPKDSIPSLDNSTSCLVDMMRNPTGPFHFSMLRKDSDLPAPFTSEADFTLETLEGSTSSSSGNEAHKIRSVHSDPNAWGVAVIILDAPLPSASGAMRLAQSTVTAAGPDPAGGYDTIKYVFDTSRLSATDKLTTKALLGVQDYSIIGTAWITKDTQCMVKFTTDFEQHLKDDTISKVHYEGSITKK